LIFRKLKKITNSNCKGKHGPPLKGEQKRSCLDYSKTQKELGWQPKFTLEKGLKETVDWFNLKTKKYEKLRKLNQK
jgi:dTDP-D-glucose 4,6-dehydratase